MSTIRTYSGKNFDIYNLSDEALDVESIAQGLSQTCRFSGQCLRYYSVAEHSCRIAAYAYGAALDRGASQREALEIMLWGLLHDASEAYLPDMPTPFKKLPELAGFRELEDKVMAQVISSFGLLPEMPPEVHEADKRIIANERAALMNMDMNWPEEIVPMPELSEIAGEFGWNSEKARRVFLETYVSIINELNSCSSCPHSQGCDSSV